MGKRSWLCSRNNLFSSFQEKKIANFTNMIWISGVWGYGNCDIWGRTTVHIPFLQDGYIVSHLSFAFSLWLGLFVLAVYCYIIWELLLYAEHLKYPILFLQRRIQVAIKLATVAWPKSRITSANCMQQRLWEQQRWWTRQYGKLEYIWKMNAVLFPMWYISVSLFISIRGNWEFRQWRGGRHFQHEGDLGPRSFIYCGGYGLFSVAFLLKIFYKVHCIYILIIVSLVAYLLSVHAEINSITISRSDPCNDEAVR